VFRKLKTLALTGSFLAIAGAASANPGDYETVFEFTGAGGTINDVAVQWFSAEPTDFNPDFEDPTTFTLNDGSPNEVILELEINGLSHTSPMDLNIFLLDPFGTGIEIMDERGDGVDFTGTLFFRDPNEGKPLPTDPDPLVDGSVYAPELPGTPNKNPGFSGYTTVGDNEWRLVIIDDSSGDRGAVENFTIRGLVVPEPATLSLLAIGATALLRRRKKA